jgi:hypothetical protein
MIFGIAVRPLRKGDATSTKTMAGVVNSQF